jgi:hypothetical protein
MTVILPGGIGQIFVPSVASTFDPAHTTASVALSNANKTATGTSTTNNGMSRGTKSHSSGKLYLEMTVGVNGNSTAQGGLCNSSYTLTTGAIGSASLGGDAAGNSIGVAQYGLGYQPFFKAGNVTDVTLPITPATGDTLMLALDLGAGNFYFGANGTWCCAGNNSTTFFPASPDYSGVAAGTWYPIAQVDGNPTGAYYILTSAAAYLYPAPSGFSKW